jgi:S-adenosylmethionine:tRNA ribosyltransferase-isomerase
MLQSQLRPHMNELPVDEFDYTLPAERIAERPLPERDASRLLVAHASGSGIAHHHVRDLPALIAPGSLLIMNNSRVVPARLHMRKDTGGMVEIFLLEPYHKGTHAEALASMAPHRWKCMIGGKNVREGMTLTTSDEHSILHAHVVSRHEGLAIVEFSWSFAETFSEALNRFGATPLPPYIKRRDDSSDKERYQTVYAKVKGSVAAPTAGLHVSEALLSKCKDRGISCCDVTLHIGLGTFEPMKSDQVRNHTMHVEYAAADRSELMRLREHLLRVQSNPELRTICIGTTSLRTAESLYHLGCMLHGNPQIDPTKPEVTQWCWTESNRPALTAAESIQAILNYMDSQGLEQIHFPTQLMIVPGFPFMICDTLLTNFHQPRSTLLVLVSAFVGHDRRAEIYHEALSNEYRFLSYGDASLLFRGAAARS